MAKRDAYIAIMVAAATGKGVNLSWEECADLALDDAISTRAANSLDESDFNATAEGAYLHNGWKGVDPYAKRKAANLAS